MALKNMDEIQWDQLECAYGNASDVPSLIQNLSKVQSEKEFINVYNTVLDFIHRDELIYPATAPAIHFLIQLLATTDNPARKLIYCYNLCGVLLKTQITSQLPYRPVLPESITTRRSKLATYDAFAGHLDVFIQLLGDDNVKVRTASLQILGLLVEQSQQIFPAILDCIEKTDDMWTQAVGAWAYTLLVHHSVKHYRDSHMDQVLKWVENTDNLHLKFVAAIAYLLLQPYGTRLPDIVFETIVQLLNTNLVDALFMTDGDDFDDLRDDYLPFDDIASIITMNCRRFNRPDLWLRILPELELTPALAHMCFREMMSLEFFSINRNPLNKKWDNISHLRRWFTLEEAIYRTQGRLAYYRPDDRLSNPQRAIIKAIVNCDPFWQVSSNLFSFYFNLPDDRHALRALIS